MKSANQRGKRDKGIETSPLISSAITTMIEEEWMRHLIGVICRTNPIIITLVLCFHCALSDLKQTNEEEKNTQKKIR